MADSYSILYEKYKRALVFIRELEQERDKYQAMFADKEESNAQVEKNAKYLCETILKKERGSNEEKTWFKMSLKDMIEKAQESLETYSDNQRKMMQKLLDRNAERTDTILKLTTELDKEKELHTKDIKEITESKNEIIEELKMKLKTGRVDEEEIEKITKTTKKEKVNINMPIGNDIEFETEVTDNLSENISEAARVMYENGEVVVNTKPAGNVKVDIETKRKVAKSIEEISEERTQLIKKYVAKLSDVQKLLIRVMGEDGFSELDPILKAAKQKFPELPSESRLKSAMHDLGMASQEDELYEKIVEVIKCPVPGSSNFCLYRLTQVGNDIYTYLFSKAPKEPEMNVIIKNHDNLEHGYGIKKTALCLQKLKFIQDANAEVIYMTRTKDYIVNIGENSKYIPDIVIVFKRADGKERKNYIEYETGKSPDTDMIAKLNKMASFTKNICIIVPDKTAKETTIAKIQKWRDSFTNGTAEFPRKDTIRIRVGTFYEIRDGVNDKEIAWKWDKQISPPKK